MAASFVALGMFWETPRLRAAAAGRALPEPLQQAGQALVLIARAAGLFALAVLLYAALAGNTNPSVNIAPVAVYIVFWVGLQVVSVLIGDVWRGLNPFCAAADASAWGWARLKGRPVSEPGRGAGNQWWAVAAVFGFVWLELAYHDNTEPRVLGFYLAAYTVAMLVGAAVFGPGWVRDAEGFGVLFTKLSAIAPLRRDADGAWRLRTPLAGLATEPIKRGSVAFILVVLGSTTFDGFTRSGDLARCGRGGAPAGN